MFKQLAAMMQRPALYEKGTAMQTEIWTDEHISKGMLEAHLDPELDAATRSHDHVKEIIKWIGAVAPADKYPALLDLGCGPGIYAELFNKAGYAVTGMDFSKRSIAHAQNSAKEKGLSIKYHFQDYLTLDFVAQFDVITLIYYDFGVLSAEERAILLIKIYTALKPGGLLIFDVYTPQHLAERAESSSWEYEGKESFFSSHPHVCLSSFLLYEEKHTFCERYIIITEQEMKSINIWEHTFTKDELVQDLSVAGFSVSGIYGNTTGAEYCKDGKEMCMIAKKGA